MIRPKTTLVVVVVVVVVYCFQEHIDAIQEFTCNKLNNNKKNNINIHTYINKLFNIQI